VTAGSRLLYISPVLPATTGNGLAMRAGMVLRSLALRHQVSLLVVPLYLAPGSGLPPELAARCRQVTVLTPAGSPAAEHLAARAGRRLRRVLRLDRRSAEPAGQYLEGEPFDVVHLFRLATLPFARPWLKPAGRSPRRHLDLDDLESVSRRRIAALHRANGDEPAAQREEQAAERAAQLEDGALTGFERVYVCSEADRRALLGRARARLCVLPNALAVPQPLGPRSPESPFTFLFLGTLGYYPNEDAVLFFCREVLPLLRRQAARPFRVSVVGLGAGPGLASLATLPEVELVGAVPDVAPWYRQADVVVVPLRAGGGTRIKVLEAFSYRRAVVSTSIGSEGLDVVDGEHLLVGDTPGEFAAQCLRLMRQPALADALTRAAYARFISAYSLEAVAARLDAIEASEPAD
jgi:glycosyltransferase involved in cell wall biosynthesis